MRLHCQAENPKTNEHVCSHVHMIFAIACAFSNVILTWCCTGRRDLAAGQAAAAQGRAGVEAKLGALTNRLLHMARKEAKREKRRGNITYAMHEP